MKKKKQEKIETLNIKENKVVRKHHLWGGIGLIIGIVIAILLIAIFSFKYINFVERQNYIKGGEDMAEMIYNDVNKNGGASIEIGNKKIVIAKYEKPVTEDMLI